LADAALLPHLIRGGGARKRAALALGLGCMLLPWRALWLRKRDAA
jgi:hypothetical protein